MMQALVTGAGGFVGGHLLTFLRENTTMALHGTHSLNHGTDHASSSASNDGITRHTLDLRDAEAVRGLLADLRPERIFHLAGQAYVPRSFEAPWETLENNIRVQLNVLQAIHDLKLDTRVLVVSSAEVYGAVPPDLLPLTKSTPFAPSSPYSVSKVTQDMLALQYHLSYGLFTVRVRPFNHIGPGQNVRFAVSSFASQIAHIERGQAEPIVYVGNLSAERDFTDVRDIVRAYHLALESGQSGDVYNVCSGSAHTLQMILDHLITLSTCAIEVRTAADRFRPVEIPRLVGDATRLRQRTGWQPQIALDQTLSDVLTDLRQRSASAI